MDSPVLRLHRADNIVVALRDLPRGSAISLPGRGAIVTNELIPIGHKLAVEPIEAGAAARKYGERIGLATTPIAPGDWVHCHNLVNPPRGEQDVDLPPSMAAADLEPAPTFQGYMRSDGRVGTRNCIAVIASVNCSAGVAHEVASRFPADRLSPFANVDTVLPLTHDSGCGMPRHGTHWDHLRRVLSGMRSHPNIAACLVIGLGCEQLSADDVVTVDQPLRSSPASYSPPVPSQSPQHQGMAGPSPSPKTLVIQQVGGTQATIEAAERTIVHWLPQVDQWRRQTVSANKLVVATECGGSDAFSGITANPAVGRAADLVVGAGGTAVLAETPEVVGAEQVLLRRATSNAVREALLERIAWWEWYAGVFGAELDHNPSPGNKAGGLSTIAEKSLGAILKGGSSPLKAVLEYAEPIPAGGFVFMDTPGFDPPSVTGMVAGGANVILFTTGRGSCFGSNCVPTIKIASNSQLAQKMPEDIDIDAGQILHGRSLDQTGSDIFQTILDVASGRKTCSEQLGYGAYEFVPWAIGPVL